MRDAAALPGADLLLCKDVLQHLPNALVLRYLRIFKQKYKFILITNGIVSPHPSNVDIALGAYRPIRLDHPPFNEPFVVLLEWFITAYGNHYANQACLLFGNAARSDKDFMAAHADLCAPPIRRTTMALRLLQQAPRDARSYLSRTFVGALWRATKRQAKTLFPTSP
jgi:hypothetical protein